MAWARKMHQAATNRWRVVENKMKSMWLLFIGAVLALCCTGSAFGQADPDRELASLRGELRSARQAIERLQERADQAQAQLDLSMSAIDSKLDVTQKQVQDQTAAVTKSVIGVDERVGYIEKTGESNRNWIGSGCW